MAASWRLLHTFDAQPGFNMALDEALLLVSTEVPALRFYTWKPAALSLGYFQRFADVPEASRAPAVVRRLTGGGAIHHANELTFSIAASLQDPLYRGVVRESYARIHGAIAAGLEELGVRASLRESSSLASDRPRSGMCFQRSTALDLVWNARKGVGSAQRRTRSRVLHHGSIKLRPSALDTTVATLEQADLTPECLAPILARAFAECLDISFVVDEPRAAELAHARERSEHFASEEFVRGR